MDHYCYQNKLTFTTSGVNLFFKSHPASDLFSLWNVNIKLKSLLHNSDKFPLAGLCQLVVALKAKSFKQSLFIQSIG